MIKAGATGFTGSVSSSLGSRQSYSLDYAQFSLEGSAVAALRTSLSAWNRIHKRASVRTSVSAFTLIGHCRAA